MDEIVRDGELSVRRMRDDDDDYALIARWRSDPRVLEWYGGRDQPLDLAAARAKHRPRVLGEELVNPCLILLGDRPIGYVQYYVVDEPAEYALEDATDVWAMDLFLGEPEVWGRGVGRRVVRALSTWLFEARGAQRIVIDPQVRNVRAIRAYERAGFRKVVRLEARELHEGTLEDVWILALDQDPRQRIL